MTITDSIRKRLGYVPKPDKYLDEYGKPKTVIVTSSVIGRKLGIQERDEKLLKDYWKYYNGEGTVFASINTIAWNTVMVGYHLMSKDAKAKALIEMMFDKMDIDGILLDTVIYGLVFGDSFVEKVRGSGDKKGYTTSLKLVDPISMNVEVDKFGVEIGYKQKVRGQVLPTKLTKQDIMHYRFFPKPNSPYGISIIEPSKNNIDRKMDVDESLYHAVMRHGSSKFKVRVGTEEEIPPQAVFEKIQSDLEDITSQNEFIIPGVVDITTIDERGVPGVEAYADTFLKQVIVGLMCPGESLGLDIGSTEATSSVKAIMFERFIKAIQHKLSNKVRIELINQILRENGMKENLVYMRFNSVTDADEEAKAKWIGNLMRGFQNSPQKPFTINEIRTMFDMESIDDGDDITWGGQLKPNIQPTSGE